VGGVTAELLNDDTQTKQAAPNFIQAYTSELRDAGGRTADQNMAISVTSFTSQSAPGGGGLRPSVPITAPTLPYHIGRIPQEHRHTLEVRQLSASKLTRFKGTAIE
jgi:hypothetical protein